MLLNISIDHLLYVNHNNKGYLDYYFLIDVISWTILWIAKGTWHKHPCNLEKGDIFFNTHFLYILSHSGENRLEYTKLWRTALSFKHIYLNVTTQVALVLRVYTCLFFLHTQFKRFCKTSRDNLRISSFNKTKIPCLIQAWFALLLHMYS